MTLTRAAIAAWVMTVPAAAEPPKRVVSMNVCTDQLAMLVAADGQLYSVSHLARDPGSSVLVEDAGRYAVNHGLAEEVFLMQPDLVLAGTYTTRATVDLLRRLGIRVEEFAPETSFDDIRANLTRIGHILEREERAEELVAQLDDTLAALETTKRPGARVAAYDANSYTSGTGTLVDAVVKASGMTNVADELGLAGMARLPLELLIMARPDLLVEGEAPYATPSLAEESLTHPAFRALAQETRMVGLPPAHTVCGTPFTAEAARILQDAVSSTDGAAAR